MRHIRSPPLALGTPNGRVSVKMAAAVRSLPTEGTSHKATVSDASQVNVAIFLFLLASIIQLAIATKVP